MEIEDITEDDILELSDSSVIAGRGKDYYETGEVLSMRVEGKRIIARVRGSCGVYDTEIRIENGELSASCNCPYEGYGCKHIAAVLYKWISEKGGDGARKGRKRETADSGSGGEFRERPERCRGVDTGMSGCELRGRHARRYGTDTPVSGDMDLEKELGKLGRKQLLELLLGFARGSEDARRDLSVMLEEKARGKGSRGGQIVLEQVREALMGWKGYIEYREMPSVAARLGKIVQSVMRYPAPARAFLLGKIAEHCISAYERCDDSDGRLAGIVGECLGRAGKAVHGQGLPFGEKKEIMLDALEKAEKDEYGFEDSYCSMLIEIPAEKEEFDFLIDEIKARQEKGGGKCGWILPELYKRGKRDKEYLAALIRNMKEHKDYWPLVEFWEGRGEMEKAVEIAEEGIKHARGRMWTFDHRLYEFLEAHYASGNEKRELLRIKMKCFSEMPSVGKYREIRDLCTGWESVRPGLMKRADRKTAVEIHLLEGELAEAYAKTIRADFLDTFKDKVAKALAPEHPEKALRIYFSLVEEFSAGGRDNYRVAAIYARRAKDILVRLGKKEAWKKYVHGIREKNKKKRALIEELSGL